MRQPVNKRFMKRASPSPGYPTYVLIDLEEASGVGNTPRGPLMLETVLLLRAHAKRFKFLFEYTRDNGGGIEEAMHWCEERYGSQYGFDRNTQHQDATARWWMPTALLMAFSNENDAFEFRMYWG